MMLSGICILSSSNEDSLAYQYYLAIDMLWQQYRELSHSTLLFTHNPHRYLHSLSPPYVTRPSRPRPRPSKRLNPASAKSPYSPPTYLHPMTKNPPPLFRSATRVCQGSPMVSDRESPPLFRPAPIVRLRRRFRAARVKMLASLDGTVCWTKLWVK
jgi:hypothetical protein